MYKGFEKVVQQRKEIQASEKYLHEELPFLPLAKVIPSMTRAGINQRADSTGPEKTKSQLNYRPSPVGLLRPIIKKSYMEE